MLQGPGNGKPRKGELDWELGKAANVPSRGVLGDDALLANSTIGRQNDVEVVESALRSILSSVAYVSMPITSGKRLYDTLTKYGAATRQELEAIDSEALYREVIQPNVDAGRAFAEEVTQRSEYPALAPGIFESKDQRWAEEEYMALWYRVIEGKAKEIHLIDDWQYSNGGVEEFVRGMEMRSGLSDIEDNTDVRVLDQSGAELSLERGRKLIAAALTDLQNRGFEAGRLETALEKLESLGPEDSTERRSA